MANTFRIVCVSHEFPYGCHQRGHIVEVGTGTSAQRADRQWGINEVLLAMQTGDVFYTKSESTGKIAYIDAYHCHRCSKTFIRSKPDAVLDNNLDNMRACAWAA